MNAEFIKTSKDLFFIPLKYSNEDLRNVADNLISIVM